MGAVFDTDKTTFLRIIHLQIGRAAPDRKAISRLSGQNRSAQADIDAAKRT
jgi:hypothetical protein